MHPLVAITLVLLNSASAMAADVQEPHPPSAEQTDPNYGLQPEDAKRIERMLEQDETSSTKQEELARQISSNTVTTTITVPAMRVNIWTLALLALLVSVFVAVYAVARYIRRHRRSETD